MNEIPTSAAELDQRIEAATQTWLSGSWHWIAALLDDVDITGDGDGFSQLSRRGKLVARRVPAAVVDVLTEQATIPEPLMAPIRRLWNMGAIYLRDASSQVDQGAQITATRSVFLGVEMQRDAHLRGNRLLVKSSLIQSFCVVEGPGLIQDSNLQGHSNVSQYFWLDDCAIGHFVKCQTGVFAQKTIVAAHAAIDGGTHPERYPLSADGTIPQLVILGPGAWIGHHASITAGARIGRGTVVAPFTHINSDVGAGLMIAGSPSRSFPLDFRIRALSADEARQAGYRHGHTANEFPVYGNPAFGWRDPRTLEIDFPEHAHLSGDCSTRLLDYQRGALETTLHALLPGYGTRVEYLVGDTVRYFIRLDSPVRRMTPITARTSFSVDGKLADEDHDDLDAWLYDQLSSSPLTARELVELMIQTRGGDGSGNTFLAATSLGRLSQKGVISPEILPSLFSDFFMVQQLEKVLCEPEKFPALEEFVTKDTEPVAHSDASPISQDFERMRDIVAEIAADIIECPVEDIPDDLASAGLDSFRFVEFFLKLEDRFQIDPDDRDIGDANSLSISAIAQWLAEQTNESGTPGRMHRRDQKTVVGKRPAVNRSFGVSESHDSIAQILKHNIDTAPSPWIFKFLLSDRPGDYRYLTWPELGRLAQDARNHLVEMGVAKNDVVTLLLPTSATLAGYWSGCILLGAIPNICANPSPKLTEKEFIGWFGMVATQSQSSCVICDAVTAGSIIDNFAEGGLSIPVVVARDNPGEPDSCVEEPAPADPDSPVILQHSSGTTNLKKAIALSDKQILTQLDALTDALQLSETDRIVSWLPLYHDMGFIANFVLPLVLSIPTVLMSPFDWIKRPSMLLEQLTEERGSLCWMPNFAFALCAKSVSPDKLPAYDLSSVRSLINGAEPVTEHAIRAFLDKFGKCGLSEVAASSCYGMAEYTLIVTQSRPGTGVRSICVDAKAFSQNGEARIVDSNEGTVLMSSGSPIKGVEVSVVDDSGKLLEDCKVGEIRVRGDCMLTAYYRDPESTERALRDGYYYTGDLGFFCDGELYVTGRKTDLVIVGGHNLYAHSIEEALAGIEELKPGRISAFASFNDELGTEDLIIAGELTDKGADIPEIEQEIRRKMLAQFNVMPGDICLFEERVLPKSTSGKISRQRCRDQYASGEFHMRRLVANSS